MKASIFILVSFVAFMIFYIIAAFLLGFKSPVWARLMQFAPYIFGSHTLIEILIGMNKLKEKK